MCLDYLQKEIAFVLLLKRTAPSLDLPALSLAIDVGYVGKHHRDTAVTHPETAPSKHCHWQ